MMGNPLWSRNGPFVATFVQVMNAALHHLAGGRD